MTLGLGVLRLAPEAFWRMTPRELLAAVSGIADPGRGMPPGRAELDRLLRDYPDSR